MISIGVPIGRLQSPASFQVYRASPAPLFGKRCRGWAAIVPFVMG